MPRPRRLLLAAAAVATSTVVTTAPASAHSHAVLTGPEAGLVVVYGQLAAAVLVASTVVLVGLVFAPLVAGPPVGPGRTRAVVAAAGIAAAVADVATLVWPALARNTFGGWPARVALAHLLLASAVVVGMRQASLAATAVAGALLLVVLVLSEDHDGSLHILVAGAHLFAATVWAGGVLHLALGWSRASGQRAAVRQAARRFGPTAAVAAVLTVSSAVAATHLHVPRAADLIGTGYGQLVVLEILVAAVVLAVAAAVRRGGEHREGRRASLVKVETALVSLAVGVGAALSVLTPPAPLVQLAEYRPPVASAACTSRHLGHLAGLLAANDDSPARYRLEALSQRARTVGGSTCTMVEESTPDPGPAALGSAYASFLDSVGVHQATIFSDGSPGSQELTTALVGRARSVGWAVTVAPDWEPGQPYIGGGDAVVIATSTERAASVLAAVVASPSRPTRGVFLAPWLLSPELLTPGLSTNGVQVSIGLGFDPNSNAAATYIDLLARVDDDAPPTAAGLEGYLEALAAAEGRKVPRPTGLRFYTASQANLLPASVSEGHQDNSAARWIPQSPNANLLPESGLIPLPGP